MSAKSVAVSFDAQVLLMLKMWNYYSKERWDCVDAALTYNRKVVQNMFSHEHDAKYGLYIPTPDHFGIEC